MYFKKFVICLYFFYFFKVDIYLTTNITFFLGKTALRELKNVTQFQEIILFLNQNNEASIVHNNIFLFSKGSIVNFLAVLPFSYLCSVSWCYFFILPCPLIHIFKVTMDMLFALLYHFYTYYLIYPINIILAIIKHKYKY